MSHIYEKIKYFEEGNYGITLERTLFCHHNNTCDVVTFYYEDGTPIFSFNDTIEGNLLDKMIEIIYNFKNNSNISKMSINEKELLQ